MKTIGIFLGKSNLTTYLQGNPYYHQGYLELATAIADQGGNMVLLDNQDSYLGGGVFDKHWSFQNNEFIENTQIQVDVIYNKSHFVSDGLVEVFNNAFIDEVCVDKSLTYQYFREMCPATVVVNDVEHLKNELMNIPSEMIVAKPVDGGEGTDVNIFPKHELLDQELTYPLLLQEFLDTSAGIPGVMIGTHDLRIAVLNGQIAYSFYRTPPAGELIANVAQGGSFHVIPNESIPPEAVAIVHQVDQLFEKYPHRYYGVDVAFTPHGVKIIELNSHLGLSLHSDGDVFRKLNQELAKTLVSVAD